MYYIISVCSSLFLNGLKALTCAYLTFVAFCNSKNINVYFTFK